MLLLRSRDELDWWRSCYELSVWSLTREVRSMNRPGLLITAPLATVRRNQWCQVSKVRDRAAAAALCTELTDFTKTVKTPRPGRNTCLLPTAPIPSQSLQSSDDGNVIDGDNKCWICKDLFIKCLYILSVQNGSAWFGTTLRCWDQSIGSCSYLAS